MCALVQTCFQTDLSFLLPCVNGHDTNTALKSCTIRGVDWVVVKARNLCKSNGVRVSPLTDEDTLKIVLKFPELVSTNDWAQLEKVSGIRANTFALESMRQ